MVEGIQERFEALGASLGELGELWRPVPFEHRVMPWAADRPRLASWLAQLGQERALALDANPEALSASLTPFIPEAATLATLTDLPIVAAPGGPPGEPEMSGVSGRKVEQIQGFIDGVGFSWPFVEWCAGKGHLGRSVARLHGVSGVCMDHDAGLCRQGRGLAAQARAQVRFVVEDAMGEGAARLLGPGVHALALHACGGLHRRLIEAASQARVQALTLAPCCYQRFEPEDYAPMSAAGRAQNLGLARADLQNAVQEHVTGARRKLDARLEDMALRLAFDAMARALHGRERHHPMPDVGPARSPFEALRAAAKLAALPTPDDPGRWLEQGRARVQTVVANGLVRHLFRRPLEVWLVLDRAMALVEAGYEVQVGTFCPRTVTPRNLRIHAWR